MGISGGSSKSTSSSNAYGYSNSLAESLNRSSSNVWGSQAPYLEQNYERGRLLMEQQSGMAEQRGNQIYGDLQPGLLSGFQGVADVAAGNPALLQQQMADFRTNMNQAFTEDVLPAIRDQGLQSGFGSAGRTGLAEGVASRGYMQQLGQGYTSLMDQEQQRRLAAASLMPDLSNNYFQMGMAPINAAWAPQMNYSQILGGPTLTSDSLGLSRAISQAEDWSNSFGRSSSRQFGFNLF